METLCAKNEKVILHTPSYGYFAHAAEYNQVEFLASPLKRDANGHFTMDLENFERCCADPKAKLVIFCNPHNPTGRMWTKEELTAVSAIVRKYNLWIISDEIHCDLIRAGKKHLPLAVMEIPEATYLAWVDLSAYFEPEDDLPSFFAYQAGVLLEGGDALFVGNANRFVRLNLAMPRSVIEKGLERMRDAILRKN